MKNKKIIFSIDKIMEKYAFKIEDILKKYYEEVQLLNGNEPEKKIKNIIFEFLKKVTKNGRKKILFFYFYKKTLEKYEKKLIKKYEKFDELLIIGGINYSEEFIKKLREKNKKIKITQYLWDKCGDELAEELKRKYDEVYSFEKEDVEKYGFKFRTSFFVEEANIEKDIDCYYLGALREEIRYKYINKIYHYCKKNNLNGIFKLFIKKSKLKDKYKNKEILTLKKISYEENIELVKRSKVVMELNYFDQKGLTLRTFEALGMNAKLLTQNEDIKNYDFYNEENIRIISSLEDIENIPIEFFQKEYVKLDEKIKEKYSLEGFIEEVLKLK